MNSLEVKKELFKKFLPKINIDEIENYNIVLPLKLKSELFNYDWILFDEYCEVPMCLDKRGFIIQSPNEVKYNPVNPSKATFKMIDVDSREVIKSGLIK